MTKTCQNLEEQDAAGMGVLPMDFLACFDYLDNSTLIKQGLDPANKEIPMEFRNTTATGPVVEFPTAPGEVQEK
jgi:hypothetical protein